MSNTNEKQSFATRAVHAGNGIDTNTGAIKHAITMANSYVLPYDATTLNWSDADVNTVSYTHLTLPTKRIV